MPSVALSSRARVVFAVAVPILVTGVGSDACAAPKLAVVEPAHMEIGEVEPGQTQKFDWTLRNDGDASLEIEAIEPTCYCTTGKPDAWSVPPGGTTRVHVTVDPSDWVGVIVKGVEVETNDPGSKHLLLDVKMTVRPGIAVVPPELDLGAVPEKGATPRTVDIKAAKTRPFKITSIAADVPWITVQDELLQTDDRAGVKLYVKPAAGVPAGPFSAKVVVLSDDPARPRIEIPVRGIGPGGLKVEPSRLVFEAAAPGADVGAIVVSGGKGVTVTGVKPSVPSLEASVLAQPDGSYRVLVRVGSGAKPGRVLAKLAIATNDDAQPEILVPVMGVVK